MLKQIFDKSTLTSWPPTAEEVREVAHAGLIANRQSEMIKKLTKEMEETRDLLEFFNKHFPDET